MKSKKILKKGFTLIELLVVVAIIGILASVVLALLGSAKNKGDDAAVQTNLHTVSNQAELFYTNNNNSYLPSGGVDVTDTCPTAYDASGTNMFSKDKAMFDAMTEAIKRGNGQSACYNSVNNWAVAIGLKTNDKTSWCVDSEGTSIQINADAPVWVIDGGICKQPSHIMGPPVRL